MKAVTLAGSASITTWGVGRVIVVAPIFFARLASASGEIVRSWPATTYHGGFDFQAGAVTSPSMAATLVGAWVAVKTWISVWGNPCAKSSAMLFGVNFKNPALSGRNSVPTRVGTLVISPNADYP